MRSSDRSDTDETDRKMLKTSTRAMGSKVENENDSRLCTGQIIYKEIVECQQERKIQIKFVI